MSVLKNKEPLRIAVVGSLLSAKGGGAPRSMANHAGALAKLDARVTIFTGYSPRYPLTPEEFELTDVEVNSSRILGPSVVGFCAGSLWALLKRAREFDVIHANGHWNIMTFLTACIACLRGVPYVITTRGHLGAYDFKHLRVLKWIQYPLMEVFNIRNAAVMHVASKWEQKDSERPLRHAKRVVRIPIGVSMDTLLPVPQRDEAREQLKLTGAGHVVLFLSRVAPDKSPELLIRAWAASEPPADSLLLMVGPATEEYQSHLQRLVDDLGVRDRIRFEGYADNANKRLYYAAADTFVLPSTDDSFSVSVIEAAYFGLHCLLSPYVGAEEYIPTSQVTTTELEEGMWAEALRGRTAQVREVSDPDDVSWFDALKLHSVGEQWLREYDKVCSDR